MPAPASTDRLAATEDLKATATRLGARLEAFMADLVERDQQLLAAVLLAAMDPVERMGHVGHAELLNPEEEEVLRKLQTEYGSE
jgi:hypothetical protein